MLSASAMALAMPRYNTLKSLEKRYYLRVMTHGHLQCLESQVESPQVKFEVEMATETANAGLVHIRSCQNNRYWVRSTGNWIHATARKPDEDQSKESCTLFKAIPVDDSNATNTFRFMHVQSGCYVCVRDYHGSGGTSPLEHCVLAIYKDFDGNRRDIFTILDWDSLEFLPKYVAFKGDNGKYLRMSWKEGHQYLMFSATDIGDPAVAQEVFVTHDGNIRLKPTSYHRFWRRSPNWIWADSVDTSNSNLDTLFRPFKVDDQTIALLNLANNNFCKRLVGVLSLLLVKILTPKVQFGGRGAQHRRCEGRGARNGKIPSFKSRDTQISCAEGRGAHS